MMSPQKPIWPILALLLGSLGIASAQTNRPSLPENRFLFIIETSRAMDKRASGVASALDQLFRSSMQGQIRPGDTIGVWTYNDELHTGEFPLLPWTGDPARVSNAIMSFLGKQKFVRQPRFDHVMPTLDLVVSNSALLTVVILSSGTDLIKGTPFDNEINTAVHNWRDEQQKARMPLVIVLRAVRGTITHYKVTPVPWQIEMPPMPRIPAESIAAKPVQPKPQPPPPSVPPLIVSGKKPETPGASPSNPPPTAKPESSLTSSLPATATIEPGSPKSAPAQSGATNSVSTSQTAPQTRSTVPAESPAKHDEPVSVVSSVPSTLAKTNTPGPSQSVASPSTEESSHPAGAPTLAASGRETFVLHKRLILFSSIALVLVVGIVLLRRSRSTHVSLITHSIDRERE